MRAAQGDPRSQSCESGNSENRAVKLLEYRLCPCLTNEATDAYACYNRHAFNATGDRPTILIVSPSKGEKATTSTSRLLASGLH